MGSFVFLSQAGCLLPFLIFFNFFFGWIFLRPIHWLFLELVLIVLFLLNSYITARTIVRSSSGKRRGTIDVEGEVVEDKPKLE